MVDEYHSRQAAMEAWYGELLGFGAEQAERELLRDYAPHAEWLGGLGGRVIDIGGGAGIAARFLSPDVDYVVVDPSEIWQSDRWSAFARSLRARGPEPSFVKAAGEALPFGDQEFDAALAFWSLNHARDPARCVAEIARVLKRGGLARIVLEDMEPGWSDLLRDGLKRLQARLLGRHCQAMIPMPLVQAVRVKLLGEWPVQDDHIGIAETDLLAAIGGRMDVRCRRWLGGWLTFDLVKRSADIASADRTRSGG